MRTSCDRARHAQATDAVPNAGEHAAKFTLDTRFARRPLDLRLGALHGLRERRDASLSVDLLNAQEMLLRRHGMRWLFHRAVPGRIIKGSVTIAVSNRRWRRSIITRPTWWRLLLLLRRQESRGTMAIWRLECRNRVT